MLYQGSTRRFVRLAMSYRGHSEINHAARRHPFSGQIENHRATATVLRIVRTSAQMVLLSGS